MSDGEAIAKPFEVPEAPDDLFCRRDFQQLRIFRPGMAIDDERVSIGKTLDHRDPCQSDSWQVLFLHRPGGLAALVNLHDSMSITGAD